MVFRVAEAVKVVIGGVVIVETLATETSPRKSRMWATAFSVVVDIVAEDVFAVGTSNRFGAETLPIVRREFILKLTCIVKLQRDALGTGVGTADKGVFEAETASNAAVWCSVTTADRPTLGEERGIVLDWDLPRLQEFATWLVGQVCAARIRVGLKPGVEFYSFARFG